MKKHHQLLLLTVLILVVAPLLSWISGSIYAAMILVFFLLIPVLLYDEKVKGKANKLIPILPGVFIIVLSSPLTEGLTGNPFPFLKWELAIWLFFLWASATCMILIAWKGTRILKTVAAVFLVLSVLWVLMFLHVPMEYRPLG